MLNPTLFYITFIEIYPIAWFKHKVMIVTQLHNKVFYMEKYLSLLISASTELNSESFLFIVTMVSLFIVYKIAMKR